MQPVLYTESLDDTADWETVAERAGLGRGRFLSCVRDTLPVARIEEDLRQAEALGTRRTPTIVLEGELILGGTPDSLELRDLLEPHLAW